MVSKRDRVIEYLSGQGIKINIGKNKAQGHRGFFRAPLNCTGGYRIDIAKGLDDISVMRTIAHEYMHYVHYKNDKSLKSLDFILGNIGEEITEELIELTVHSIKKDTIKPLFDIKSKTEADIEVLSASHGFLNSIQINNKKKLLKKINAKISRLNRYYNMPTELLARSFEIYLFEKNIMTEKAPNLLKIYEQKIYSDNFKELKELAEIIKS